MSDPVPVTVILGCTASGKSALAHYLARQLGTEVVSVDSMKVYRRMDIGTAKPTPQARAEVPHHLIDVVEPSEPFSAGRFVQLADAAIADIAARRRSVIAAGGTALYLKALVEGLFEGPSADPDFRAQLQARADAEGWPALHTQLAQLDPEAARRIHPNDAKRITRALEVYHATGQPISALQKQFGQPRPEYRCTFIGLRRSRQDANRRINARVKRMMQAGFLDEVRSLLAERPPLAPQARQALGYAELIDHLEGRLPLDKAIEKIKVGTRRFAKQQRTWFRTFRDVHWIDLQPDATVEQTARTTLDILDRES